MRVRRITIHIAQALTEAALVAALAAVLVAGTAFAGKPGGGASSTTFRVDDGVFAQTTTAHRGASTATWVRARCYRAGTLVYEQYVQYDATGSATLQLGPTMLWEAGSATCTGEEGWWRNGTRWRVVGSDSFTVTG